MPMGKMYVGALAAKPRAPAAFTIQKAYRKYRSRKRTSRSFNKRVQNATISMDPQQYMLRSIVNRTAVTQSPTVYHISNIYYNRTDQGLPNPKYYRSSNKIKVQNLHMDFRIQASKDAYNTVCVALVRHKRSRPVVDSDVQASQLLPPANIPNLEEEDKPFLPLNTGAAEALNPTSMDLNFGSTVNPANTESLATFFNPKVVDLIWHKTVTVQPLSTITENTAYPTGWPFQRVFSFNKKLDEIWKYPSPVQGTAGFDEFPTLNNKCYSLICWSDSFDATIPPPGDSHPMLDCNVRLSFKDID